MWVADGEEGIEKSLAPFAEGLVENTRRLAFGQNLEVVSKGCVWEDEKGAYGCELAGGGLEPATLHVPGAIEFAHLEVTLKRPFGGILPFSHDGDVLLEQSEAALAVIARVCYVALQDGGETKRHNRLHWGMPFQCTDLNTSSQVLHIVEIGCSHPLNVKVSRNL